MFQISLWDGPDPRSAPNTMIALADDATDALSLAELRTAEVINLVALPGLVSSAGPSRVIGCTRVVW